MARDYKKKQQAKKPVNSNWKFLFSGFGMGLVAAFIMYKNLNPTTTHPIPEPVPAPTTTPQSVSETERDIAKPVVSQSTTIAASESLPEPGEESDFDFYKWLPEFEVVVSDNDDQVSQSNQANPSTIRQKPNDTGAPAFYVLQAGSFKSFIDADRRKAELAFKGIESTIQQVVLKNNQTWYRVYVGPSDNVGNLENMRSTLRKDGIDAFFSKVKKP